LRERPIRLLLERAESLSKRSAVNALPLASNAGGDLRRGWLSRGQLCRWRLCLSQRLWGWGLDLRRRRKRGICRGDVLRQKIVHGRGVLDVLDDVASVGVPVPVPVGVGDGGGIGDVVGLHVMPESDKESRKKVGKKYLW
jgi:hypothetical protein